MSHRREYIPGGKDRREEIVDVRHLLFHYGSAIWCLSCVLAPPEGIKDESQPSVDLSIPQLNSTAQVLNQLHALKSQQIPGPSSVEHDTYPPVYRLPMLHGGPHVGGLEDMGLRPYMVS